MRFFGLIKPYHRYMMLVVLAASFQGAFAQESTSTRLPGLADVRSDSEETVPSNLSVRNQFALDQLGRIGVTGQSDYFKKLSSLIDIFRSNLSARMHVRVPGGNKVSFEMKDILAPIMKYENFSKNSLRLSWDVNDLKLIPFMQVRTHVLTVLENRNLPWHESTDSRIVGAAKSNQLSLSFLAQGKSISSETFDRLSRIALDTGGECLIFE